MLALWDLPVQQSEVLKFGAVPDRVDDMATSHYWNSSNPSSETSLKDPQPTITTQALDFQRHCASCGHALQRSIFTKHPTAPDTPSKRQRKTSLRRCPNCRPRQALPTKLPCVICGEVVDGMLIPCLSCGHVSCFDCHRRWFLQPDHTEHPDQKSLPACPTGCGCQCSEHIAVNVPMPVETVPTPEYSPAPHPAVTQAKNSRRRQSEPAVSDPSRKSLPPREVPRPEDDLNPWEESSPFASLARGLGGGLSRGLRGKEERRKNKSVAVTPNVKSP